MPNAFSTSDSRTFTLKIATRGSPLALWQAEWVQKRILEQHPEITIELLILKTSGDRIQDRPLSEVGGKGLFIKELEGALLDNRADLAVHSMKDVPGFFPEGLEISVIAEREDPGDAWLSPKYGSIGNFPQGAVVGTSSLRRASQLKHHRQDLQIRSFRGNVQTRIRKLDQGEVDAAEDVDGAVDLADVVLVLGPGPGGGDADPAQAHHHQGGQQPAQPGEAARGPWCVARGLRVDRVAGDGVRVGRQVVGERRLDRRLLAGVAAAAEQTGGQRGAVRPTAYVGGRADHHRLEVRERVGALGGAGLVEDVGDQAGDVVAGAGLERATHQLDGGEVGGALAEDDAQVLVVEGGRGPVGAHEQPVAGL